jgi:hypothetical protein
MPRLFRRRDGHQQPYPVDDVRLEVQRLSEIFDRVEASA